MEKRETFICHRSFMETCEYVQKDFFPRLKKQGVAPLIDLFPPVIVINEPKRFGMKKRLDKRMSLRVEVAEDPEGKVYVVAASSLNTTPLVVKTIIATVVTCGFALLIGAPLILWRLSAWNTSVQKAAALLKADLDLQPNMPTPAKAAQIEQKPVEQNTALPPQMLPFSEPEPPPANAAQIEQRPVPQNTAPPPQMLPVPKPESRVQQPPRRSVACHSCKARLKVPPGSANKKARCPRCRAQISL